MPKMKTKRALAKRVKKVGKLKINSAYTSHLAHNKTHKQKRQLRKASYVSKSDYKRIKYLMQ